MRNNRLAVKIGLLVFLALGGVFFLVFEMSGSSVPGASAPPVEAVAGGGVVIFPLIAVTTLIVLLAGVGAAVYAFRRQGGLQGGKRKRSSEVEAEAMAMLDDMIEQGVVRLVDDDERAELDEREVFYEDGKPVRLDDQR